ncbi:hypothetical protein L9F63_012553, partial [Diploptera punctata]
MVRAWYMDFSTEDQRLEHHRQPPHFVDLDQLHKICGVEYFQLNPSNPLHDEKLEKLKIDRNYTYEDEIICSKECLPNYDEKLKNFFTEHLHTDEEIRLVLTGSGYFDVRDGNDEWIRIEVVPGDLIVIPAGIYHRFTLDSKNYIKAKRFFIGEPVWTPHNRPADEMECRTQYLCKLKDGFDFRAYAVKRKYPINQEEEEKLPVFQYASSIQKCRVYVWGLAEHGALGINLQLKKSRDPIHYLYKPVRIHLAEHHKIVDIACGYGFTVLAINTNEKHKLFGCGINTDSQIGYHAPPQDQPLHLILAPAPIELPLAESTNTRVKRVSAGRAHTMVLTDKEGVFTLGNNAYGQCGRKIVEEEKYAESRVVHNIPNINGATIKDIECGQDHSLFITEHGEVFSCGWGADGQTGLGHFNTEWQPSKVTGDIVGESIVKVSSKSDCVLALN